MLNQRIYKFDNIKWFCILLVAIGHFIDSYADSGSVFRAVFIFIYSFHMPLFIFLNGLFQSWETDSKKFKLRPLLFYIIVGYVLKTLLFFTDLVGKGSAQFHFLGGNEISWFLFVLAAFYGISYLLKKVPPIIVLIVSFLFGLFAGYVDFFGDFLWLSRIFVFSPFYFAGLYLTSEKILEVTSKIYIKIGSAVCILLFAAVCLGKNVEMYRLRTLFTGRNPFSVVPIDGCGVPHRLLCYFISAVMCFAIMSIVPNKKLPRITEWGANTISVYFWHNFIRGVMIYAGVFDAIINHFPRSVYGLIFVGMAFLLTVILSLKFFSIPFHSLNKLLKKIDK